MNIFILDTNPQKAARYHCDQHVIKMILESAQMLCTAIIIHGGRAPYAATHRNHPCTIWTAQSNSNWNWLKSLAQELNNEYRHRYKKAIDHKSWTAIKDLTPDTLPTGPLTPFAQAMPEQYRHENAVLAYRSYYEGEKARFAHWKHSEKPDWYSVKIDTFPNHE